LRGAGGRLASVLPPAASQAARATAASAGRSWGRRRRQR
jgi:hypothetical protein